MRPITTIPFTFASLAAAWTPTTVTGIQKGFNYGATTGADFEARFSTAQHLTGAPGFTSARVFTMLPFGGDTSKPYLDVFEPALATNTKLLLGLWCSAGRPGFESEKAALQAAISAHKMDFRDLVVGISVGSEDIYRSVSEGNGIGESVDNIRTYITETKKLLADNDLAYIPVGHVDTWKIWRNDSLAGALIANDVDFIGLNGFSYWEDEAADKTAPWETAYNTVLNLDARKKSNVPIWVTETGFPTDGDTSGEAVPSPENAGKYWQNVGCGILFEKINTWWYILQDPPAIKGQGKALSKPSFGVVANVGDREGLFPLECGSSDSEGGDEAGTPPVAPQETQT